MRPPSSPHKRSSRSKRKPAKKRKPKRKPAPKRKPKPKPKVESTPGSGTQTPKNGEQQQGQKNEKMDDDKKEKGPSEMDVD